MATKLRPREAAQGLESHHRRALRRYPPQRAAHALQLQKHLLPRRARPLSLIRRIVPLADQTVLWHVQSELHRSGSIGVQFRPYRRKPPSAPACVDMPLLPPFPAPPPILSFRPASRRSAKSRDCSPLAHGSAFVRSHIRPSRPTFSFGAALRPSDLKTCRFVADHPSRRAPHQSPADFA